MGKATIFSGLFLMFGLLGHPHDAQTNAPAMMGGRPDAQAATFAGSRAGDKREINGIELRWCPPGRFRMGSPPSEPDRRPDEAQVDVTLTQGFWMGQCEV